jgi:potassium efflux system protein
LLSIIPLPVTQRNASAIVKYLTPVIIIFYSYIVFILALKFLGIYPTKEAAMESLQSIDLSAGSWVISPGTFLSAGVTIYGIFIFSKAIQGLLFQEVLPRYNAAKGVQFSIVRLVNYAILSVGFFMVLHVLGFELKSLTIFGGALGIGIGFGLQAIISNVVSGLILLFERPIKVGDMIQVNNEYGEIKKVGLRATVVETLDNSEIVIPNSELVVGTVTNWTLGERRVRVKIPVGVAYGTDTTKVLEILMSCADECPMVLSNPPPRALFLSFGDSSLNFELRVWIPEFNDRRIVLSELNQEINNEFEQAGITIPFPQRDLHLQMQADE